MRRGKIRNKDGDIWKNRGVIVEKLIGKWMWKCVFVFGCMKWLGEGIV